MLGSLAEPSLADFDAQNICLSWVISHVPMFHITQPLGINGLLDGYYKVMSNIPKMGHLPTPVSAIEMVQPRITRLLEGKVYRL